MMETGTTGPQRSSAFEIMRLAAMFMIVLEHAILATTQQSEIPLSLMDNIGWFIKAFTICAVNLFFLLTGYFLRSGHLRSSRVCRIWMETIFYSVAVYIAAACLHMETFSVKTLMTYCFPVLLKKYWFMQTYIVLAFLLPFLAIMLDELTERQHLALCVILLLFFSLHETFIPVANTLDTTQGYGLLWGGALAVIGNYLSRYGRKYIEMIRGWWFAGYILMGCGIWLSNYLIVKFDIAQGVTSRANFYAYNSISTFLESVCLFCFFIWLSYRGWHSTPVNRLASSALSVYLISAHPALLYPLWVKVFRISGLIGTPALFVAAAVLLSVLVEIVCIGIDKGVAFIYRRSPLDSLVVRLDHIGGENR